LNGAVEAVSAGRLDYSLKRDEWDVADCWDKRHEAPLAGFWSIREIPKIPEIKVF
jgi:hypothetical protein